MKAHNLISRDILWKAIVQELFEPFMHFFYPEASKLIDFEAGTEFLDKELDRLFADSDRKERRADNLAKVKLKNGKERYLVIHIEVQGYKDDNFSERMFTYYYRIFDFIKKPIAAIAIFTDDSAKFFPKKYAVTSADWDISLEYTYKSYKLYEQNIATLQKQNNIFADLMIFAWYGIKKNKPKNDEDLLNMKTEFFRALLEKGYSKPQIYLLADFIMHYIKFKEPEYLLRLRTNFSNLTQSKEQMTLREAIIEEVREKSLEIGEKRGEKRGKQIGEQIGKQIGKQIGEQIGKQIGENRGKRIGKQIGKKITAHKTAFKLFDKGYDVAQICDLLEWEVNTVQESFDLYHNLQDNNQEALNNAILGFFQEGYEVEQVCELLNWQPEMVQPLFDRFVENRGKEEDNDLD